MGLIMMSKTHVCLEKFAQSVPFCFETETLLAVKSIFSLGHSDRLVVVDENQYPQGLVYLQSLLPHLLCSQKDVPQQKFDKGVPENSFPASENTESLPWQKPLSGLSLPIIGSLRVFPAYFHLGELWPYLKRELNREMMDKSSPCSCSIKFPSQKAESAKKEEMPIALVDVNGKFLGLLDSLRLLEFIAQNYNLSAAWEADKVFSSDYQLPTELKHFWAQKTESLSAELAANTSHQTGSPQKSSMVFPSRFSPAAEKAGTASRQKQQSEKKIDENNHDSSSLVEMLEELPVPLMLQTRDGEVLSQNLAWRSQVGNQSDLAEIAATVARLSHPKGQATSAEVKLSESLAIANGIASNYERENWENGEPELQEAIAAPSKFLNDFPQLASKPKAPLNRYDSGAQFQGPFSPVKNGPDSSVSFCPLQPEQERVWQFDYRSLFDLTLVLARDVTEQHLVAKELEAKNADLIQLNRLKDEFLACISHELKTPLTAVLGLSSLLKGQALGKLNDRQARYANLIHESGRHLMMVVNDILDLTQIETGQMELNLAPVKIQEVCDRAYEQIQEIRSQRHFSQPEAKNDTQESASKEKHPVETKLTLEIEPGLDMLVADSNRLRQMLVNLLSNALKFTPIDGKIGLRVNRWERWIAFTVWDTGIGIPPDKQHLIFQKFQQLESPLTRQFEGTGLGLVLTQRLARLHGGDVTFISKQGKGSEFTLLLPPSPPPQKLGDRLEADEEFIENEISWETTKTRTRVKNSSKLPITSYQIPINNYSSRLILIVEAVPRFIEDLSDKLTGLGYRVVIARTGTEAVEKARRLQPRAIFINPILPMLSGWDVLTLLKTDPDTCELAVVIAATQGDKQRAFLHKADGFLTLPVQQPALEKIMADMSDTQPPITEQRLTILRLIYGSNSEASKLDKENRSIYDLSLLLHPYDCRIIEADDIAEAELLARIWHPDVILLERIGSSTNSKKLVEKLSHYPGLISIPVVTLDYQTTEAANQVKEMSVFPCLASGGVNNLAIPGEFFGAPPGSSEKRQSRLDSEEFASALWQVISAASGLNWQPSILVVDVEAIAFLNKFSSEGKIDNSTLSSSTTISQEDTGKFAENPSKKHLINAESTFISQFSQIDAKIDAGENIDSTQALIQYIKIAGFRGLIGRNWGEVWQQLQYQSVDLLLICLHGKLPSELVAELSRLKEITTKPPILVWEDSDYSLPDNLTEEELNLVLEEISTQILPASLSMSELLDWIKQTIYESSCRNFKLTN